MELPPTDVQPVTMAIHPPPTAATDGEAKILDSTTADENEQPPSTPSPISELEVVDPVTIEREKIAAGPMRIELKRLDKKVDSESQYYYTETVIRQIDETQQVDWWNNIALCLIREYDYSNFYIQRTYLQINSQHIKTLLKDTIGEYPGISFHTKEISIDAPYHVLFHYRAALKTASEAHEADSEASAHAKLLLEWIDSEFKDVTEETTNLVEQGMISFQHLWTLLPPGTLIYASVLGQARLFKLQSYAYGLADLKLTLTYHDFDGEDFGVMESVRPIRNFGGASRITELNPYPLKYHGDPEGVKTELVGRGRRFEGYAGVHFSNYSGIALEHSGWGMNRFNTSGRVVVDAKTFHRLNPDTSFEVARFGNDTAPAKRKRAQRPRHPDEYDYDDLDLPVNNGQDVEDEELLMSSEDKKFTALSDEQCLLLNATVRGFSFVEKRWFEFFVDKLSDPGWYPDAFTHLVLPAAQKDLVRALVSNHIKQTTAFDDIIKGKGKGLIMVLHGPPGVGKTLTAETVAEYCQRPLYSVSAGDLGIDSTTLDANLTRILDMATTWKAVLLIDEADVFLEKRSLHDLQRNSLVSIFLRLLEYYQGILILTSNRVNTFDDAFKSRIHVPLKYHDLDQGARKQIWANFLGKIEGVKIADEDLERLAKAKINGRQIKNVVSTARALAGFHGEVMDCGKLEQVVRIQEEFEAELGGSSEDIHL